jgi:hypothetical protein
LIKFYDKSGYIFIPFRKNGVSPEFIPIITGVSISGFKITCFRQRSKKHSQNFAGSRKRSSYIAKTDLQLSNCLVLTHPV